MLTTVALSLVAALCVSPYSGYLPDRQITFKWIGAGIAVLLSGIAITIIHYFRNRGDESFVGMMALAGISVLSLFSYPFRYPLTVLGLLCALVLVYKDVLLRCSLLHIGVCHKTTRKQACRQVQASDTRYLYTKKQF